MSDPFVVHALSYCLGKGEIQLKGRIKRPWLKIQRPETERTYLDHQIRKLRKFHDGPHDAIWDRIPGPGFYDIERLRFKGSQLWHVYELLYPRDEWTLTPDILRMTGMTGIAALWCDCGHWKNGTMRFGGRDLNITRDDYALLATHLADLGFHCRIENRGRLVVAVTMTPLYLRDFIRKLRPHVHRSMHHTLVKPRR